MSKMLIDDNPLLVLPNLAIEIGLNEALVLQQIHFWLKTYKDADKQDHFKDSRWWVYNTKEGWQSNFPWWSESTVWRALTNLRDMGMLIVSSKYNKKGYDRTLWYTIDYDAVSALEKSILPKRVEPSSQNEQMDQPKMISPIPETNTETSTETNISKKEEKEDIVEWFGKRETPQVEHIPLTAEERKARTADALFEGQRRAAGMSEKDVKVHNYIQGLPADLRVIGKAFCTEFGRPPLESEKGFWIKGFRDLVTIGVAQTNIEQAMRYMRDAGLPVSHPGSVKTMAEHHKRYGGFREEKTKGQSAQDILDAWKNGSQQELPNIIDL